MNLALQARWDGLAPHSRRWVVVQFVLGALLINAILNATIAWVFTLDQGQVSYVGIPLIDKTTLLVDSLGTLFILAFLTTLIVTTIVRKELEHGELVAPAVAPARLPHRAVKRAALVGAVCFAVLAIPVTLVSLAAGSPDMTIEQFLVYKAIFGALYGLPITPAVALLAMEPATSDR